MSELTSLLTEEERAAAARIARRMGADYAELTGLVERAVERRVRGGGEVPSGVHGAVAQLRLLSNGIAQIITGEATFNGEPVEAARELTGRIVPAGA